MGDDIRVFNLSESKSEGPRQDIPQVRMDGLWNKRTNKRAREFTSLKGQVANEKASNQDWHIQCVLLALALFP